MHDDDPVYTPDETAEILRAGSSRTLERWRTTGTGPAFVKIGRRVGYRQSAINAYLQQQTRRHTAEKKS
jgi:predicted DNA-binding transcriptional regulator AlpA